MLKKNIGKLSLALALIAAIWLILGMFNVVPLVFKLPNETYVRSHASLAVIFLLIASWTFWNED